MHAMHVIRGMNPKLLAAPRWLWQLRHADQGCQCQHMQCNTHGNDNALSGACHLTLRVRHQRRPACVCAADLLSISWQTPQRFQVLT
jgi:hypothetical protein